MPFREQFQEQFQEQISRLTGLAAGAARRTASLQGRITQAAKSHGAGQPQAWLAKARDLLRRSGN
jgi:hypothetical protein